MRKTYFCFRFLVLFLLAANFVSVTPNVCFAAREDVVLGKDYQLKSEKEALEDKFSWEVDLTYGLSNVSRLLGLGTEILEERPSSEYLDTLGMAYSKNDFLVTLGGNYLVNPRLELSAGVPVSLVLAEIKNGGRRRRTSREFKVGAGDAYASISYAFLTESNSRPLVVATFEANSALSKFTSMGDGFWGLTPGLYLRKFIAKDTYLLGMTGYTHRLKRKGVTPGRMISYGGGVGFLSEDKKIELSLERSHSDETKIGNRTVIDSEEDLTMSIAFTTILGSQTTTIGVFLSGLEEGFNWTQNSAGIFMGISF